MNRLIPQFPALGENELLFFRERIQELAGIALPATKDHLIESRLRQHVFNSGLADYSAYRKHLEGLPPEHPEWQAFINLLTTNKTDFFREPRHFQFLTETLLPQWLSKRPTQPFRVWSCASSTGEEAYTLAMILERELPRDHDYEILGTDIDTEVLKTARNAVYPSSRLGEIPADYHADGIDLGRDRAEGWFRLKTRLHQKVRFEPHNLIEPDLASGSPFDLILCRNVMIYFSRETVQFVARKLFAAAKPSAHLFIGHSESFQGLDQPWSLVRPAVLRKGPS